MVRTLNFITPRRGCTVHFSFKTLNSYYRCSLLKDLTELNHLRLEFSKSSDYTVDDLKTFDLRLLSLPPISRLKTTDFLRGRIYNTPTVLLFFHSKLTEGSDRIRQKC